MNTNERTFSYITWNIQGLLKYTHDSYLKRYLEQFDFICLCETWARYTGEFDNFLPNYVHFDSVRKLNLSSLRNDGGVSVFVRTDLFKENLISRIYNEFNDAIVLLFKLSTSSDISDVVMYFTYISPEGSYVYNGLNDRNGINILQNNFDQIMTTYPNALCLLSGDLNARTKDYLDYIPDDNLQFVFGDADINATHFDIPRATKDCNRYNSFGRSLINFCCSRDMRFLNGRFQDVSGNFTCFAADGASIVDYFVVSENLFHLVSYFDVIEYDLSDHLPISCSFKLNLNVDQCRDNRENINNTNSKSPKYRWNHEKSQTFIDSFKNSLSQCKDDILQSIDTNINDAINNITLLYQNAARSMRAHNTCTTYSYKSTQPPWWDQHCCDLKRDKYRALRKFRLTNDFEDLDSYKQSKRSFKQYIKTRKSQLQKQKRNVLIESRNNPTEFWKILKRENCESQTSNSISNMEWYNHFRTLLFDPTKEPIVINDTDVEEDGFLNAEFNVDEILQAISKLGKNKSPGNDGLSTEFYTYTKNEITPILCCLFNKIFQFGSFPISWGESIICPIHKSGPKNDPNNYRGISLTTSLYKIFSIVLNSRLYSWAESNNKIDEAQAGFRRGYSAIDNVFNLQAIVQKYLSRQRGRLYCIYIDFKKAFDKISHVKLFQSLQRSGVNGKFLSVLSSMYKNLHSCVRTTLSGSTTDYFPCNIGTRQGDVCSPIIFSLFINELNSMLRSNCTVGIFIDNSISDVMCLMFADDVANCAETVINLQRQINVIDQFCVSTGMELNLNKTEIIVFRNGGHLSMNERWYFRGEQIKTTNVYKYMGLLFTPSLSWMPAQHKQATQAQKAIFAIFKYQKPFGHFDVDQLFKLFDSMIKPILCYGSQIWGYKYCSDIESIQHLFCCKYLGVKTTTNMCIVLGECGRLPLCVSYFTYCIKYWCKIITMEDHRYPKHCYFMLKSFDNVGRITWATHVKNLLFLYGFGFVWVSHEIGDITAFISIFRQRLIDCFTQDWHRSVTESSRCYHYQHFKTLLNTERYLSVDLPVNLRYAFARFRTSSHHFNIELGRYQNIPLQERICNFCSENRNMSVLDCEFHVLFHCGRFDNIRTQFLENWYTNDKTLVNFYTLLSSTNQETIYRLATFIDKILSNM